MPNLLHLPTRDSSGAFHVVVESPRGSAVKLKYDPKLEVFVLSRPLNFGLSYPFDWGFIPGTHAPDGDPLDAAVLLDAPTFPGVVHRCRALGVVRLTQKRKRTGGREHNDRIIAMPARSQRFGNLERADQLPRRLRNEVEHFFVSATMFEGKEVRIEGWEGPEVAEALIDEAQHAYRTTRPDG